MKGLLFILLVIAVLVAGHQYVQRLKAERLAESRLSLINEYKLLVSDDVAAFKRANEVFDQVIVELRKQRGQTP